MTRSGGELIAIILAIVAVFALAKCGNEAKAHDKYHDWLGKDGVRCCTDLERECRPVRSFLHEDGLFRVWVDGRWREVPSHAVLDRPSPDGRSHACISRNGLIFCYVNGSPRS